MNILLVDDDIFMIEALKSSLDFKRLGIENAYYAYSVEQAKQIMKDVDIHILVSDIEMPIENGFVLLEWIREQGFIVQKILLTSYAEFKYATQAIQYNCSAYALKPIVTEELEKLIEEAVQKEQEELINADKVSAWNQSLKKQKDNFFDNLFRENQIDEDSMKACNYTLDTIVYTAIVRNFEESYKSIREEWDGMAEWEIHFMIREAFLKCGLDILNTHRISSGNYLIFFEGTNTDTEQHWSKEKDALLKYFKNVKKKKNYTSAAIITNGVRIEELREWVQGFTRYSRHKLLKPNEIMVTADIYGKFHEDYVAPDFTGWEKCITEGRLVMLENRIKMYFEEQEKNNTLSPDNLRRLIRAFEQHLFYLLKDNGYAEGAQEEFIAEELYLKSQSNVTEAIAGMMLMVKAYQSIVQKDDTLTDKAIISTVIEYIDYNLDKELTRENIASLVYLNPDYLAKIFKAKTRKSMGNYILEKRMDLAKEYLSNTDESINEIAGYCGYNNNSYFGKVFKDYTGLTPKDYRKENKK